MEFKDIVCKIPHPEKPDQNGYIISLESAKNGFSDIKNMPVLYEDIPIGIAYNSDFLNDENASEIYMKVWDKIDIEQKIKDGYTFVPEIMVNEMDGNVIKDFSIIAMILTNEPAIESYTEIIE